MEQKDYEENCKKMQDKMIGIAEALLAKVKSTTSPIDYLVTIKKLNDMIDGYSDGFATLANVEFDKLLESTVEGDDIVVSGAVIKRAFKSYSYEYPDSISAMEDGLKKAKEIARNDGSAKKGSARNKRDFTISIKK